jgi:uncharacterized protein YfdQ (DUF2303 family)
VTIDGSAIEAIADLTRNGVGAERLELGGYYTYLIGGRVELVDLTGDQYRDAPTRKVGTTTVRDVPSWLAYYGKHHDPDSEIYADRQGLTVTAVLDAHGPDQPRFGTHRLVLRLRHSDEFTAWQAASGRMMSQTGFAEFLEDHRGAVVEPAAADMVELAQTFQAKTKVDFKSSTILASGQRQLTYVEQVDASAGQRGQLVIPPSFTLALQVFEGAAHADAVTARLRYRINDGSLQIGFVLDQLAEVVSTAFVGVVGEIEAGVTQPVLYGTPA